MPINPILFGRYPQSSTRGIAFALQQSSAGGDVSLASNLDTVAHCHRCDGSTARVRLAVEWCEVVCRIQPLPGTERKSAEAFHGASSPNSWTIMGGDPNQGTKEAGMD